MSKQYFDAPISAEPQERVSELEHALRRLVRMNCGLDRCDSEEQAYRWNEAAALVGEIK